MPFVRSFFSIVAVIYFALLSLSCSTTKGTDYVNVGNEYARDGLLREAGDSYQKALQQKSNNSTARRNLGIVQVKLSDYKNAVRNLEKSMNVYEDNYDANFYLAEAYRGLDQYAEAIFRYQRANKLKANDPRTLKSLAWSFFKIRYYSQALATTKQLLKAHPNDGQAAIIMARTQLKSGDNKGALATIQTYENSSSKEAKPYFASVEGDALYAMGRNKEAITAYQSALKEQPLLPGALLGMGRCLLQQKQEDRAIVYMERAIRIRPKLTEAIFLLAKAYEGKDPKKSLRFYAAFMKQAERDPEFISQLEDVKTKMASLQGAPTASEGQEGLSKESL